MRRVKETVHYFCNDTLFGHIDGHGVTTAVLDTGISPHPDLKGRIVAFGDMLYGKKRMYDDNSHGTHVAGIIAGSGGLSSGLYAGIAPASQIVAVKVLDQKGEGKIRFLIEGIKAILRNRDKWQIRIVNISIGTLPHQGDEEEMELMRWVDRLWDEGLVVVTAAGNFGPRSGTVTIPGISKKVITVGASDDGNQKGRYGKVGTNYSGRGPTSECVCKPDLVAPGSYIRSCNGFSQKKNQKAYSVKSGTSMSAPVVSGAVALLLSKYPDMKNVEVKLRLLMSADDIGKDPNIQGRGLLNIEKLLNPTL
ncbi:S8 family peptidase [Sellimonas intestinalis]|uniref:S8 family peptidase n=1 Tax=Sellimonas intestinalis TaxID=1653434 RepID=UPI0022E65DD1|nr:S8 family peptidase [Sellimonas intestinalis]